MRSSFTVRNLVFSVILLTSAFSALGKEQSLGTDPLLSTGKLPNGLTYYIRPNAKPAKHVELRLVINAGSILENDNQRGLAHFVEHMAFNGSTHFKKNELVSFLQSIGVKFGGDLNASTGFDSTQYILPIPTDKPENLETGFTILEDWAGGLSFDLEEINKERGVVLEEARLGKGASDRVRKQLLPKIFEGSRYAERLPIGSEQVIASADKATIEAFYRDWYRPDLMAVVVVGDITVPQAQALIQKHFAHLKNPSNARVREQYGVPERKTSDALVITDAENTNSIVQIIGKRSETKPVLTDVDFRNSIATNMITSMLNQRLSEKSQQSNPPYVNASSSFSSLAKNTRNFTSSAVLGKDGSAPAIAAIVAENERARRFGFTEAELQRSKLLYINFYQSAFNEREKTQSASLVNDYIANFLNQESLSNIEQQNNWVKQIVPSITLAEINALAAHTIPANSSTLIALIAPSKTDYVLPKTEALNQQFNAAFQQNLVAYTEKTVGSELLKSKPVAGKIIKQSQFADVGIHVLDMSNGTRVLLKPTDFKNDQVILSAYRDGGMSGYTANDNINVAIASSLGNITGLGEYKPSDLAKVQAGKIASASVGMGAYSDSLSGSSSAKMSDIENMLQLITLQFTAVRSDEELFASFATRVKPILSNQGNDPNAQFSDFYSRKLYNDHPKAGNLPSQAQIDALNLARSLAINREHFSQANGMSFVLVGSFDVEKIKPLLEQYLGGLPSDASKQPQFVDEGLRPIMGKHRVTFHKGKEDKATSILKYHGTTPYTLEAAFNLYLLEEILRIQLTESLRENLSGAYTVGLSSDVEEKPYGNFEINITIPSSPANAELLIAASKKTIANLVKKGPSQTVLDKVKATYLTSLDIRQKENAYWLGKIAQFDADKRSLNEIPSFNRELLKKITAKDLQKAAKKYLNGKNLFEAILLPEVKTEAPAVAK